MGAAIKVTKHLRTSPGMLSSSLDGVCFAIIAALLLRTSLPASSLIVVGVLIITALRD